MPERIPHEPAAEEPERIVVDLDARGDAIGIEGIVLGATVLDREKVPLGGVSTLPGWAVFILSDLAPVFLHGSNR